MIFLIVFICCVFELIYVSFAPLRSGRWIQLWHRWLCDNFPVRKIFGGASLLVSFALPCAVLAYIFGNVFADSVLLTLLGGTALLLFCSGPGDIAHEIESYTRRYLDEDGNQPPPDTNNFLNNIDAIDGDPDRPYLRAIAIEANARLFAPIFWFSVLGPVGALLFRMSVTIARSPTLDPVDGVVAKRLYDILIWAPARLLGIGLGLGGTLGPVVGVLSRWEVKLSQSEALLGDAAIAALETTITDERDQHAALINSMFSLVKRGFVVWLAILALLVVAGVR
jgi:AmpE protein